MITLICLLLNDRDEHLALGGRHLGHVSGVEGVCGSRHPFNGHWRRETVIIVGVAFQTCSAQNIGVA